MTELDPAAALVLFSGGQDSATCLAWALEHFERVETVGFRYGQNGVGVSVPTGWWSSACWAMSA